MVMIDLNFLYCYSVNKRRDKEFSAVDYLQAQALIKEDAQNFANFYEGVISERILNCVDDAHSELTPIDLFILLLDKYGYTPMDFFEVLKINAPKEKNIVDKLFYSIAPDLRIFGAIREIRCRENYAFFSNARRDDTMPYELTSTEGYLFKAPLEKMGDEWLRNAFYSLANLEKKETEAMDDMRVATLCSTFYLTSSNLLSIDKLPKYIDRNIVEVVNQLNEFRDKDKLEQAINIRNTLYANLFNEYFSKNFWDEQYNFLDGLVGINKNGKETYDIENESASMISYPQYKKDMVDNLNKTKKEEKRKSSKFSINKSQCDDFRGMIVGQDEAVDLILDKLISVTCGFVNKERPIVSLLLNGPTGVGKTQTAKAMAETFFDDKLYTVDMTHFKSEADINMLIGSSAGYVGYDDKNAFIEFIKNNPKCVLLFDEIDKASPVCLPFMMRLLDEGKFTTAKGEVIDVSQCAIIATTNQKANISKDSANRNLEELSAHSGEIGSPFLKEFMGRFDNVLEYNELTTDNLRDILKQKLDETIENFEENSSNALILNYGEELIDDILNRANSKVTGARALNESIQDLFIRPITRFIINNPKVHEARICVLDKNKISVNDEIVEIDNKKKQSMETAKKAYQENLVYFG